MASQVQKNMKHVRAGKPQKGSRAHRFNSEAESQIKSNILIELIDLLNSHINKKLISKIYRSTNTKTKLEEAIPSPLRSREECSSTGSRRPGHPHSTPWSCEKDKTKLTAHIMQDCILPSVLDRISTRPDYAGELFVGFLTNQALFASLSHTHYYWYQVDMLKSTGYTRVCFFFGHAVCLKKKSERA